MIKAVTSTGKVVGYYDNPADLREDYPEAEIHNGIAVVEE